MVKSAALDSPATLPPPASPMPDPRSEIRRGALPTVFGWLGGVMGLLATSTVMESCAFSHEEVQRIRWNLPWVAVVVFVLVGVVLRHLLSGRKTFLLVAAAGTAIGLLIFSVAGSLLYKGELGETLVAFAYFACPYGGLFLAALFVAFEARRPGSGVTRTRRVIAAAAAPIGLMEILTWGPLRPSVVAPIAAVVGALSVLACAVLLVLLVREGQDIAALSRGPRSGPASYRQPATQEEDAHLAAHRRARRFVAWMLAIAIVGSLGAPLTWQSQPPPRPPAPVDFRLGGC